MTYLTAGCRRLARIRNTIMRKFGYVPTAQTIYREDFHDKQNVGRRRQQQGIQS